MKRAICALILSSLILLSLIAASPVKTDQPAPDISEVLRAHNVPQHTDALKSFVGEAVKLVFYDGGDGDALHRFFERKVRVSTCGVAFKRHSRDALGLRVRVDLFDGRAGYRAVMESGARVGEANIIEDSQLKSARFAVATFGLAPILKQISRQPSMVFYAGRAARNEDMFQMRTEFGLLAIFADQQRLIRRVEAGNKTIEYADYRNVSGSRLPFIQRLYVAGRLVHELIFTEIDLAPTFPAGYFSRESFPN